jgi:hypothetical protein
MSAFIETSTDLSKLARSLGRSIGQFTDPDKQFVLDFKYPEDVNRKISAHLQVLDSRPGSSKSPRSDTQRHDAATAFTTSALSHVLAPVFIQSAYSFLFTPGMTGARGQLLPVNHTVPLGKTSVEWPVVAYTGEAKRMAAGSTRGLPRVGTADDLKSQPVGYYGVRFGWDWWELNQATHLGRSVQTEQQQAASMAMAEYHEAFSSYGDTSTKRPGFFNHGSVFTVGATINLGTTTSAVDMMGQLSRIHQAWKIANPNRVLSGVIMPESHRLNMLTLMYGTGQEGQSAWNLAVVAFPWLSNIVTDDRLETASQNGRAMWQFWSADSQSQYIEATPTPLMFGPFNDELETTFILIGVQAGVVNKDPRAIMRVNFPA